MVFHRFPALGRGMTLAGYAAMIVDYELSVPTPSFLCAIGFRHRRQEKGNWRLFTPRHKPTDSLCGHLTFALKYEGIDLAVLKALFESISAQEVVNIVESSPTGAYSRRIWFLYEWLCESQLDLEDATQGNYVSLVNNARQYPGPPRISKRHRIHNNLPGTREFCPLIRRTTKLDDFIGMNLSQAARNQIRKFPAELLSRATAHLLLNDSKASYAIEGETPIHNRVERWGKVIAEAGQRALSVEELERLQSVIITDSRFIRPGYRIEGGFVGDHERTTGTPIPTHISARHKDLPSLMSGLIEASRLLNNSSHDPVLTAALIAFGFVFIHPFEDGNGRIHRYLFHHVLVENGFVPKGLVFPISSVILERIDEYRSALEYYSKPRLDFVEWSPTDKGNVEVSNETIDLYRYFDATKQAEFLFECVEETVNRTLPEEIEYLAKHDLLNEFIHNFIDMPNKLVALLILFLNQNDGKLSKRARNKEFTNLTEQEVKTIENKYDEIFRPSRRFNRSAE